MNIEYASDSFLSFNNLLPCLSFRWKVRDLYHAESNGQKLYVNETDHTLYIFALVALEPIYQR